MKLAAIHHVAIIVSDYEKARIYNGPPVKTTHE